MSVTKSVHSLITPISSDKRRTVSISPSQVRSNGIVFHISDMETGEVAELVFDAVDLADALNYIKDSSEFKRVAVDGNKYLKAPEVKNVNASV